MDTRSLQKLQEIENRLNEALSEDLDNDESFDMEAFEEEIVGYKEEIQDMEDMDYLHMCVSDEKKINKVKGLIEKDSLEMIYMAEKKSSLNFLSIKQMLEVQSQGLDLGLNIVKSY